MLVLRHPRRVGLVASSLLFSILLTATSLPAKDGKQTKSDAYYKVSLEESVGKNWFREDAEVVIECSFIGFLGAETV